METTEGFLDRSWLMKSDAMRRRAGGVKLSSIIFCVTVLAAGLPARGRAQVNSGSDGQDGAFNPNANNPPAIPLV